MSGTGAPKLQADASTARVAVIASRWHQAIMDGLLRGARNALDEAGARDVTVVRAAGSFELAIVAQSYANAGADVIVALGVIIRGGTPHFDYIAAATTNGLSRVCLDTGVPIGFGVLTCDTEQQALDRAGLPNSREDKGREAAEAALATYAAIGAAQLGRGKTV